MKKRLLATFFTFVLILSYSSSVKSQTVQLLAGNTLNGAMNGTILGGASMAIGNSSSFYPLQVGLGLGTLYGIGMGAHDIIQGGGSEVLVSGLFNDGNNSSIIVLLDTFYGAAAGSIIVTSVMLVANQPLVDGLQYGAGIGAWAGFGFGLFDTFFLAKRTNAPIAMLTPSNSANGLIALNLDNGTSFGFVNPSLVQTLDLNSSSFSTQVNPSVDFLNIRINF